jgi:hypothetical protein
MKKEQNGLATFCLMFLFLFIAVSIPAPPEPQAKITIEIPKVGKVKRITGLKQLNQMSASTSSKVLGIFPLMKLSSINISLLLILKTNFFLLDPITEGKLSQVVAKIVEMLKSSDLSQQLKAVKAIQTLVTEGCPLHFLVLWLHCFV